MEVRMLCWSRGHVAPPWGPSLLMSVSFRVRAPDAQNVVGSTNQNQRGRCQARSGDETSLSASRQHEQNRTKNPSAGPDLLTVSR